MHSDIAALLRLQQDDQGIRDIEARRDAVAPQLAVMDQRQQRVAEDVARTAAQLQREQLRVRDLEAQRATHRDRLARQQAVLDGAQKLKEATAALAQVEATRKAVADAEREWLAATRRVTDVQAALAAATEQRALLAGEQADARQQFDAQLSALAGELALATARRAESARDVSPTWLARYERLAQRRRGDVVFAVREDFSCGSCDTAIPKQRRPALAGGQVLDVCEGCGALVYCPTSSVAS